MQMHACTTLYKIWCEIYDLIVDLICRTRLATATKFGDLLKVHQQQLLQGAKIFSAGSKEDYEK